MSSFVVKRGNASVKEEGLRAFLWPKRWLVLREQTLSFHKNEASCLGIERSTKEQFACNSCNSSRNALFLRPGAATLFISSLGTLTIITLS